MRTSDKGMAPQESPTPRDPAQRERTPMDTTESSAPHAHPTRTHLPRSTTTLLRRTTQVLSACAHTLARTGWSS
jgi:hypothetical protein